MKTASKAIAALVLSSSPLAFAAPALPQQNCEAGNSSGHHGYIPPAWVMERRNRLHQPMGQPPAWARPQTPGRNQAPAPHVPPMPALNTPRIPSSAPAYRPAPYPYYPGPAWNPPYGRSYMPWSNNSNWGPMDGLMDGDSNMNFGFNGNMSGRGHGNGYNSYHGSWWDTPVLPLFVEPQEQEKQKTETAAPVSTDDDGDGVNNLSDLCTNTPIGAKVNAFGCQDTDAMILRGVHFHTDSDRLTDDSVAILDRVVNTLRTHPEVKLEVSGHTDSRGDDAYNKDLSERRAVSVMKYLVEHGVNADSLIARGYGEERPIAGNDSKEGMAENRRVELNRLDK
jgi:outer membrane protein OmpA-like peptidoglycan-associated protein